MRIARTIPPAAAPFYFRDIISGIKGLFDGQKDLYRFTSDLKDFFEVEYCFLLSSGKAALTLLLTALKDIAPERNEVIMPAYICYSVPSSVVKAGLKVVPCDMQPGALEMDLKQFSALLNKATLCVIVPHLFGLPAGMPEIVKHCHEKGIIVIEDAAQATGVESKGKLLGTQGDVGFFSLGRGKTISSVEGGILITNDSLIGKQLQARFDFLDEYSLAEKVVLIIKALLLCFFTHPNLYWFPKLLPFLKLGDTFFDPDFPLKKMSGVQAGLAQSWEKRLTTFNDHRRKNTGYYIQRFSEKTSISLFTQNKQQPICLRFPIFIEKKEDWEHILSESEKKGFGLMYTYPDAIDVIPELNSMFKSNKPAHSLYPEAGRMAQHILTLPVHPFVSETDTQKITEMINPNIAKVEGAAYSRRTRVKS